MSLGSQGGSRTPQPLHELAMAKDEVKARLAPIPVFTVANPKNEFVLVAGEVSDAWLRATSMRPEWPDHPSHIFVFHAEQHTARLLLLQTRRC